MYSLVGWAVNMCHRETIHTIELTSKHPKTQKDQFEECAISLNPVVSLNKPVMLTCCKKIFEESALEEWNRRQGTQPTCALCHAPIKDRKIDVIPVIIQADNTVKYAETELYPIVKATIDGVVVRLALTSWEVFRSLTIPCLPYVPPGSIAVSTILFIQAAAAQIPEETPLGHVDYWTKQAIALGISVIPTAYITFEALERFPAIKRVSSYIRNNLKVPERGNWKTWFSRKPSNEIEYKTVQMLSLPERKSIDLSQLEDKTIEITSLADIGQILG